MKVALVFWGLPRSIKYTLSSIKTNIFNILEKYDILYHTYAHFFTIDGKYTNIRTNENIDDYDNEQYKLLEYYKLKLDSQEEI